MKKLLSWALVVVMLLMLCPLYAAADSEEPGVVKVAWLTGSGKLTAVEGKESGLMLLVR